jgi:hypothetical protein
VAESKCCKVVLRGDGKEEEEEGEWLCRTRFEFTPSSTGFGFRVGGIVGR